MIVATTTASRRRRPTIGRTDRASVTMWALTASLVRLCRPPPPPPCKSEKLGRLASGGKWWGRFARTVHVHVHEQRQDGIVDQAIRRPDDGVGARRPQAGHYVGSGIGGGTGVD